MGNLIAGISAVLIGRAGESKGLVTSKTVQGIAGLYFSPEIVSALGPVIHGLAGGFGFTPPSDALLQAIVAALAALWAVWGRWKAEKPLMRAN